MRQGIIVSFSVVLVLIVGLELFDALSNWNFEQIFTWKFFALTASCLYFIIEAFKLPMNKALSDK